MLPTGSTGDNRYGGSEYTFASKIGDQGCFFKAISDTSI
jgi:hypothetical protein